MMRSRLVLSFVAALTASMLLGSPAAIAEFSNRGVVHTVFLWLKDPGDAQHRQQLLVSTERLRSIPGIVDIRYGETIESDRDIVDDSFDVGIYFYFRDVAAMQQYLTHPLHQAVVDQEIKPLVARIVVHDFRDTIPAD